MQVSCRDCGAQSERDGLDALPGGFGFACPACGHANILAPVDAPPPSLPPAPALPTPVVPGEPVALEPDADGAITCPKCHHQQLGGEACHRCGLMFAYVASGRARFDSDPLGDHPQAEAMRARWATIAEDLGDEAGHLAFVELCAVHDLLEYAGECYRRLEDPRVERYRQKVVQLALARVPLEVRAESGSERTRRLIILTIAALILLGFAYGYYLITRHQLSWQGNG